MNVLSNNLKRVFSIDLRTLALVRVCLASVIIADLISRARDLVAHYSDAGILPRADLLQLGSWRPSFHLMSGSSVIQAILFVIAGVIAFGLLVGYRTRLVTFLSWIFLLSLQARNLVISQGGDLLLLMLIFWGMFLPLGARFSVDSALDPQADKTTNAYFSAATVALLLQVMSVYFFSALLKSSPAWIPDGTAVERAVRIDYITTFVGVWLRQFPTLTQGLTYFVWFLELLAPLFAFLPLWFPWIRLVVQVLLIGMHVGFFLCLRIGLFPAISITSLLALTPGWVWDKLGATLRTPQRLGVKIYYDRDCAFCLKTCRLLRMFLLFPETPISPAQDVPSIYATMQAHNSWVVVDHDGSQHIRWQALVLLMRRSVLLRALAPVLGTRFMQRPGDQFYEWVALNRKRLGEITSVWLPYRVQNVNLSAPAQIVVAGFAVLVVWVNLSGFPGFPYTLPKPAKDIRDTLALRQRWNMFAPAPSTIDGWYVVRGLTRDGTVVDVLKGLEGEPDFIRPLHLADEYPNYRWRKYLTRITSTKLSFHQPYWARYLCRSWNASHPPAKRLASMKIYFNSESITLSDAPRPVERLLMFSGPCKEKESRKGPQREQAPDPQEVGNT